MQHAHAHFRQVVEVQALVKRAVGTKQKVAQGPVAPAFGLILHRRKDYAVAIDQLRTDDRR